MPDAPHIPPPDLLAFSDNELPLEHTIAIEDHLRDCASCRWQLGELERGNQLYRSFHEQVLKPVADTESWPVLRFKRPSHLGRAGWLVAACAACLAIAAATVVVKLHSESREFTRVLTRAEAAPANPNERIEVSTGGDTWFRPALLSGEVRQTGFGKVQVLFVSAHYSWQNPLSARSFAAWRSGLLHKRDHVSSLRAGFYLVRTDTADSSLRSAALTLGAADLTAIHGEFRFDQDRTVRMTDTGEQVSSPPPAPRAKTPQPPAIESPVSPADELRVLAALDQIGADVNDPITVEPDRDRQHVLVTGVGIPPHRQDEIRGKLVSVPRAVIRFLSHPRTEASPMQPSTVLDGSTPSRALLERQAGGPQQLENLSAQVLEESESLLAQAHALDVVADTFPPSAVSSLSPGDQVTLAQLRTRHSLAIAERAAELEQTLKPLLPANAQSSGTASQHGPSWQYAAATLYEHAHTLDDRLGRLLAGQYSQEEAQNLLGRLRDEIENVQLSARQQASLR